MQKIDISNEWFLRLLVDGDGQLAGDAVSNLAKQLGICCGDVYVCIAARYAPPVSMMEQGTFPSGLRRCLLSFARTLYKNDYYCYISDGCCPVLILPTGESDRAEVVNRLHWYLEKHSDRPVQLGVGRCVREVSRLSHSKVEAFEALNTGGTVDGVAFVDDIYVTRNLTIRKPEGRKRQIIDLFKTGQLDRMLENTEELAEIVRAEAPAREGLPYPSSIRRTIVELLVEILHISADAGVDVDNVLGYEDPYTKVFSLNGTPLILNWFFDVTKKLYSAIGEVTGKTRSRMLTAAIVCIEENLSDPELSLSMVSEELCITPSYFSAFFIREIGTGFNEYITNLRIEKARRLLISTNQRISDIAAACGFRSASYFNSVFRKCCSMSPGDYRNMKK